MKRKLGIVILVGITAIGMAQVSPWKAYELYSWQRPDGGWNFCMVPSPSGVNITAEQVFKNNKCLIHGVSNLNRKIAALPGETEVFWLDRFSDTHQKFGKGGTLSYPPSKIVMEVKHLAERHKIKLDMDSGTPTP